MNFPPPAHPDLGPSFTPIPRRPPRHRLTQDQIDALNLNTSPSLSFALTHLNDTPVTEDEFATHGSFGKDPMIYPTLQILLQQAQYLWDNTLTKPREDFIRLFDPTNPQSQYRIVERRTTQKNIPLATILDKWDEQESEKK